MTHSPVSNRTLIAVGIIIIVLGVVSIVLLANQSSAVHALRQSSSRSECRTRVTNDAEDQNRHDNAQLFVYVSDLVSEANGNRLAEAQTTLTDLHDLAQKMNNTPSVQSLIDSICPKPLVDVPTTRRNR